MRILLVAMAMTPSIVFAKTVVLRAPEANPKDYHAFVLSSPTFETASQAVLKEMPSGKDRETLGELFAKAQASFVEGALVSAIENFKAVVAMAEGDQWGAEEQSVLLHSYLRLAQLTHTPQEKEHWLEQATVWAPNGVINESYFPPPLLEQMRNLKKNLPMVKVDLRRFAQDFDYVLINGRVITLPPARDESLPQGNVRVSFVSNAFQTVTIETTADQIEDLKLEKKPWVEGSCVKPQLRWSQAGVTAQAFFSRHCAPLKNQTVPKVDLAYQPPSDAPLSLPVEAEGASKTKVPFYRRTWFWVGVGAVATAIVVASLSKQETQPSTHDGF